MSSSSTRVFTIPLRGFQAVIFDLDGVVIRQEQLAEQGVEVYESTVELIRELRWKDVKTAIVSSSRNCVPVLRAAGLLDLFDARIDGSDLERLGLQDKPKAAMFLAAVNQLGVEPACAVVVCAVVVEDSISSVEAGSAGKFGMVIAVDHARHAEALRQAGANLVVQDLVQIRIRHGPPVEVDARELPSALDCLEETARGVSGL